MRNQKHTIKKTCVVIPTYNESANIRLIVAEVFQLLPNVNVLVVDDNSPDGTAAIVRRLQKKYPHLLLLKRERKEGLGAAYIAAFKHIISHLTYLPRSEAVRGHISHLVMMDADFSHNPTHLPLFREASKHYDLVIGSRYLRGGRSPDWEMWRRWLSACGNFYVSAALNNFSIHDWTGGFNCINLDMLQKIDLEKISSSGYAFQIELKYLLMKLGARIKEIPIIFEPRRGGESKLTNHIIWEGILAPWKLIRRDK